MLGHALHLRHLLVVHEHKDSLQICSMDASADSVQPHGHHKLLQLVWLADIASLKGRLWQRQLKHYTEMLSKRSFGHSHKLFS